MGGGDRKRRAIHFKTFKSLHVIFLFLQAKKASRESQGYVCIGTIQDPPGTKSKVSVLFGAYYKTRLNCRPDGISGQKLIRDPSKLVTRWEISSKNI